MNDIEEACRNCRFYKAIKSEVGVCRRNPASLVISDAFLAANSIEFDFRSEQPRMLSHEWCGEWRTKAPTQMEAKVAEEHMKKAIGSLFNAPK